MSTRRNAKFCGNVPATSSSWSRTISVRPYAVQAVLVQQRSSITKRPYAPIVWMQGVNSILVTTVRTTAYVHHCSGETISQWTRPTSRPLVIGNVAGRIVAQIPYVAARQHATRTWWNSVATRYELAISWLVLDECSASMILLLLPSVWNSFAIL